MMRSEGAQYLSFMRNDAFFQFLKGISNFPYFHFRQLSFALFALKFVFFSRKIDFFEGREEEKDLLMLKNSVRWRVLWIYDQYSQTFSFSIHFQMWENMYLIPHLIAISFLVNSGSRATETETAFYSTKSAFGNDFSNRSMMVAQEQCSICIDPKEYPVARKDETIVDDFHGTKVCAKKSCEILNINKFCLFLVKRLSCSSPAIK